MVDYVPFPYSPDISGYEPSGTIEVSVLVSWQGNYVELNDRTTYIVADGSFDNIGGTHRQATANSPFLPGTALAHSVAENLTVALSVWVLGDTTYDKDLAKNALVDYITQPNFTLVRTIENSVETYQCIASDWTVSSTKPYLHARRVLLQVQLKTQPFPILTEAF